MTGQVRGYRFFYRFHHTRKQTSALTLYSTFALPNIHCRSDKSSTLHINKDFTKTHQDVPQNLKFRVYSKPDLINFHINGINKACKVSPTHNYKTLNSYTLMKVHNLKVIKNELTWNRQILFTFISHVKKNATLDPGMLDYQIYYQIVWLTLGCIFGKSSGLSTHLLIC